MPKNTTTKQMPDFNNMTDAEFEEYLRGMMNNEVKDEMYETGANGEETGATGEETGANGEEIEAAAEETADNEASGNTPYKTFATPDEYNAAMEQYAQSRYGDELSRGKEAMDLRERLSGLAGDYYDDGEEDPIGRLMGDLESQTAQRRGQSPDEYRQATADRRDAEAYRAQQQAQQTAADETQSIIDRWNMEAERLKQNVPDFDLNTAMENEEFRNMVVHGASIDGAYYAVKYNEIKNAAPAQQTREPIMQNARTAGARPGNSVNEMMALDDNQFRKRLKRIMNGE